MATAAAAQEADARTKAPPPADAARTEARLLRPAYGGEQKRQEPQPFRIHPELARRERQTAASEHECDFDALLEESLGALAAHVQGMDLSCVAALFGDAPRAVRYAALAEPRVLAVADGTRRLAEAYAGANALALARLYLYLRAGDFVQFYDDEMPRWSGAVEPAMVAALDAIAANPRFLGEDSNDHGILATVVIQLMDGPTRRGGYLAVVGAWLARWNPTRAGQWDQRSAATAAFILVFHCSHCPEAADDVALATALRNFALGDWMVGTPAEVLAASASRELARLLEHVDAPITATVRSGVRAILNRYDALGEGAPIWVAAALMVSFFDDCAAFGICAELDGLEDGVLTVNHPCAPGVRIRGQDLSQAQLAAACERLAAQAAIFHRRFGTDPAQPLEGDVPLRYEAVAFADYDNYQAYSPLFFGNDTNNGGIYLEGDPAQPGNVSRHLGHVATWLEGGPIWNLEHEFVHHLDAHYNLLGQFHEHIDFDTVWWAEGLAEYLSLKDDNPAAVAIARTGALPLATIFETTYASDLDRVYRWSYLAVRFLFEGHPQVLEGLLAHFRVGDFAGHREWLAGAIGADHDAEWQRWLQAVEALPYRDLAAVPSIEARALSTSDVAEATLDLERLFGLGESAVRIRASSSDPQVATVAVAGTAVSLVAVGEGEATITITIANAWGDAVRTLVVTVVGECPPWQCRSFARGWRVALGAQ